MPKQVEEDEGPSQEWLASYADAMTLLLAFFIMMFAFALVDEGKFFDLKVGVVAALGIPDPVTDNSDSILADGQGITPEVGTAAVPSSDVEVEIREKIEELEASGGEVTPENVLEVKELLEQRFDSIGAADFVEVGIDERGVFIRFDGQVLFRSGSTDIADESLGLLAAASDVVSVITNPIDIEGHTDNVPTGSRWSSNWELSAARASSVVEWMIDFGSIPPGQLSATGRADTRPRGDNNTEEGRATNRRVEIVVRVDGIVDEAGRVVADVPVIDPIGDDPAEVEG
ncbi:MAG: OmpA/MotB family protein [Acidimicrobiales bacterium]